MSQAIEEGEGRGFDQGVSASFDQAQGRGGLFGQEPFMSQTNQPVRNIIRIQTDVFGPQLFAAPPVPDRDIEQDTFPGQDVEQWIVGHGSLQGQRGKVRLSRG